MRAWLSLLAITLMAGCSVDIEGLDEAISRYNAASTEVASTVFPAADADREGLATSLEHAVVSLDEMADAMTEQCPAIAEGAAELSATFTEAAQVLRAGSQPSAAPDPARLLDDHANDTTTWAEGCGLVFSDGQISRPQVSDS